MARYSGVVQKPLKLFIAYAQSDSKYRDQLAIHLAPMQRQGEITYWYDRLILPGQDRASIIDECLENADIILLLVSPDLLAASYVYDSEVRCALDRHANGDAIVVPILVRPCFWLNTPLSQLQVLPANNRAIKLWSDRDSAWLHVTEGLYSLFHVLQYQR